MYPDSRTSHLVLRLGASVAALGLALPAVGQVTPYGSGTNPPGSLVVTSGVPQVGQTFTAGVSNTATSSAPASLAFLAIASAPDPAFPAGTVLPGFGLSAPGAPGELLISLVAPDPLSFLGPVPWAGAAAAPADFTVAVPPSPGLSGVTFYLQGLLLDPTAGPSLGLTNGLAVTLAGPGTATPTPCVSQIPGMATIQAGTFLMGSNTVSQFTEMPVHSVTLSYCFWMGATEVTQAQYQALMGTNPSSLVGPDRPVEEVTWFDAQAYCAALTAQQAALGKVPAGYQYRLPTEAEWEYACRAGTTTIFNVGNSLFCNQARIAFPYNSGSACASSSTLPVASYPPNAWGLHDMHGNVWEWCLDAFNLYPAGPVTDPFVQAGLERVYRGGSWLVSAASSRSAHRSVLSPTQSNAATGFRVVLAPILVP